MGNTHGPCEGHWAYDLRLQGDAGLNPGQKRAENSVELTWDALT